MNVLVIAVTGASGLVGQRLLPLLTGDPAVDRVVALDVREPALRSTKLSFHRVDIAGTDLRPVLEDVDVVVHLAGVVDPIPDEVLMARVNVEGTRRVLAAAAVVGVRKIVRVSSATVYGAWPNNAVPLTEDLPLRPNAFSPAVQGAEVERLLSEWRAGRPDVCVTTLRSATVVGPGAERLPARIFLGRPPLRVRGAAMPVQVVHVDDLASALALVAAVDLPGVYNVAADGWLDADAARALVPSAAVPAFGEEVLERALARTWSLGVGDVPPGIVPYLVHPWVVANDKLRAAGWTPRHSNEEAIAEAVRSLPPRRPVRTGAIVAAAGGAVVVAGVTGIRVGRRVRRRARARQRTCVANPE
ncbi:MAG: NAD-dependent epimerase/dehydratase family protein [Acidimicrobiia bacterium]